MAKKTATTLAGETAAEAFQGLSLEGSKRFWQGRRARGKLAKLARESGGEDARFGRTTFPLAPPLPRGYAKGGGGVAGVPDFQPLEDGTFSEPSLTNEERRWLEAHDMPFPTANRTVVLRRIQEWDAEIAARLSRLKRLSPELDGAPLLAQASLFGTSTRYLANLLATKKRSRTRRTK